MCRLSGYLHLIVPANRFRIVAGDDALRSYRFNTRTANHLFCAHCGIKAFYVPRSHPEGFSVNARCLDTDTKDIVIEHAFDGRNWEQHIDELPRLET